MNRARAKRRLLAWERYEHQYPDLRIYTGRDRTLHKWWMRAHRHHTTHAGIQAVRRQAGS